MKLSLEQNGTKQILELTFQPGRAEVASGQTVHSFERMLGSGPQVFIQDGRVIHVSVLRKHGDNKVDVLINGMFHTLCIVDEKRKTSSSTSMVSAKEVKAVMPGRVLKIGVKEGQTVSAGDPMLVLEAMKMENEVKAAVSGVIEKIFVQAGSTVETGTLLVRIA